jgi:nitrite reductase (NADH) large subunit
LQFAVDGEPDPWHEPERARIDPRQFIPIVPVSARGADCAEVTATIE